MNPHLNVSSASHPGFLQGGPSSWQRNAWEWAPSLKATLFQGPGQPRALLFMVFLPCVSEPKWAAAFAASSLSFQA